MSGTATAGEASLGARLPRLAGERRAVGGHRPFLLDDPGTLRVVLAGQVDLYAVALTPDGRPAGTGHHLTRLDAGEALFGSGTLTLGTERLALRAVATMGTEVWEAPLTEVDADAASRPALLSALETWIAGLSATLTSGEMPASARVLSAAGDPGAADPARAGDGGAAGAAGSRAEADGAATGPGATGGEAGGEAGGAPATTLGAIAGEAFCGPVGRTVWVEIRAGACRMFGDPSMPLRAGSAAMPLTGGAWIVADEAAEIAVIGTARLAAEGGLGPGGRLAMGLARFQRFVLQWVAMRMRREEEARAARRAARAADDAARFETTLGDLGRVLDPAIPRRVSAASGADAAAAALRLVAEATGLPAPVGEAPATVAEDAARNFSAAAEAAARAAGLRLRAVRLEPGWHRADAGPLLATLLPETAGELPGRPLPAEEIPGARPVALLPERGRAGLATPRYTLHDPVTGESAALDAARAARLAPRAYAVYRPFAPGPPDVRAIMRHGLFGQAGDVRVMLLTGLAGGLLGLATPLAIGHLFGEVVPRGDLGTHVALVLGLALAGLGGFVFEAARGVALLRLSGRMDGSIQSAVWDRLLTLRADFFRRYSAGDLADRANGIGTIRELATGATVQSVFSGTFALLSVALLFWYAWDLALVALVLVGVLALATLVLTRAAFPARRAAFHRLGRVEGLVFQLLGGLPKLRAAGAETRAFARWGTLYAEARAPILSAARLGAGQQALGALFPVAASVAIFAYVFYELGEGEGEAGFTLADFLAFNAAFGQFAAGAIGLANGLSRLAEIGPIFARVEPILAAAPERRADAADPGALTGRIELSNVSFRYHPDTPPVLDDLSVTIRPGEFVAFVGPSGSGKSTLLRLLLGFEAPQSGGVYYDGLDLAGLDVGAVRRQIGTVLQASRPTGGSILENVVGAGRQGEDAAWRALELAGLAGDVRAMPMGLHTPVAETAGNLSGGQLQRLMLARALALRPRILLLDEATSALDNQTQDIVNRNLEAQRLTRIVVAHRLSTIVNADRIVVLEEGRLVEEGRFGDLMAADGTFARLARRQLL